MTTKWLTKEQTLLREVGDPVYRQIYVFPERFHHYLP